MRIRYNIIFIPILLFAGLAVWWLGFREEKQALARRLTDRALVDREQVDIIELIRPDQTIRLEKSKSSGEGTDKTEDWLMVQPYKVGCDPKTMADLVDGIFKTESERDISGVTPEQLKEYGLTEAGLRIKLASSSGGILMDLAIGLKNTSGTDNYAAFADHFDDVFLVPIYEVDPLMLTAENLRDSRALDFDPENVAVIQLSSSVADLRFEKQDSRWILASPETFPASPARLGQLFHDLQELRAKEYLPENADNPQLAPSTVHVVLTSRDNSTQELTLHGEDYSRGIFATSTRQPSPFIVEAYIRDRLSLDPKVFFHVLLFDFAPEQVQRIHIRQPAAENLEIERTGKGAEDWKILRPEGRTYTDPGDFESFVSTLLALEPADTVPVPESPEDYGFEPVYFAQIEITLKENSEKATLFLGSRDKNGDYYATQDGRAYLLVSSGLIDKLLARAAKLKGTPE